jgi:hypothetical protein
MRIWIALLTLLAAAGMGGAQAASLDEGITAYRSGDFVQARELLEPLAQGGDFSAQYFMGEMALKGQGTEANVDQAFDWYLMAATSGHAQAQANVGSMIALGLGEKRDMATAYYWLILSAVWTDTPLQSGAFAALGEVADLLTPAERKGLGDAAARVWTGGQ